MCVWKWGYWTCVFEGLNMCVGLYTCPCGFVSVCAWVCLSDFMAVCVFLWFEVCWGPLICCPELVNNWHFLLITSTVKKYWVLIYSLSLSLSSVMHTLPRCLAPSLCICLSSVNLPIRLLNYSLSFFHIHIVEFIFHFCWVWYQNKSPKQVAKPI